MLKCIRAFEERIYPRFFFLWLKVYSSVCRKIISCKSFGTVPKLLAQKLDTEKMQKVPCQNSEPEFSKCDKTFETKFWLEIFWHGILDKSARISSKKFRLEMLFRHADPLISSQWPYSEILRTPHFQTLKYTNALQVCFTNSGICS